MYIWKKKAVVFTNVTVNAYQGRLNAGFSKVCAIFKLCTIESLKYIWEFTHRFVIVATFPLPETWRWMKPTVIGCLTCRSKGLMGGPWLNNAAIYCRPSSVSLNRILARLENSDSTMKTLTDTHTFNPVNHCRVFYFCLIFVVNEQNSSNHCIMPYIW